MATAGFVLHDDHRTDGKRARQMVRVKRARQLGDEDELIESWATERTRVAGADVLGRPAGYVVPPEDRQPIVTNWSGPQDFVNAPPSYDVFYSQYFNYTRWLVSRFGVPSNDLEDVVADIITRFIERDSIGVFSREWVSRSATGKSNFRSYYSRFIVTYARGKNRNIYRHNSHHVLLCDAPLDEEKRVTWIDENAPTASFEESSVNNMDFVVLVSELRQKVDPKLVATVDAIVEMVMGAPVIKVTELARTLGVPRAVVKDQIALVRSALSELVGVPG